MKKNAVKLNEAQLRNIVAESVKRTLKEYRSFTDLKNYDNDMAHSPMGPSRYGTEEYMKSYCEKWLKWANVYGAKWANENNEDVNKVLHAAENYIKAITTEPDGLVHNYMDTSPKRDAYDYFFKDHGIEQSLENERIMGNNLGESKLNKIVAESVKKVLKEEEGLQFQRRVNPDDPKKNVGPKDENVNFFIVAVNGSSKKILGDKDFKTRQAAENAAKRYSDKGLKVHIISKKA